ncbi:MAG TPA: sugar ABC transporter permease, partial [Micromonospora sp.]
MTTDTMPRSSPLHPATAGRGAGRRRRATVHPTARGIWPFVVPAAVVTALLVLLPMAYTVWLSVTDRQSDGTNAGFLGADNYARMFADPAFYNSLKVTLLLFVVCLAVETLLGLALGYVMSLDVPGRQIFQGMMLIPAITASVAVGLLWLLIMDPSLGMA